MQHKLTLEWIEKNFDKFNNDYWGGTLRKPKFGITNVKSYLGAFRRKEWKICISKYFDRSERDYANTLIHEMIHLYIRQNMLGNQKVHHGMEFYKEADRLNGFGWNIARTDDINGIGLTDKSKCNFRVICYHNQERNIFFRFCINPKKESFFLDFITHCRSITFAFIFSSTNDNIYGCLPKCIHAIRGRSINKKTFEEDMKNENIEILKGQVHKYSA